MQACSQVFQEGFVKLVRRPSQAAESPKKIDLRLQKKVFRTIDYFNFFKFIIQICHSTILLPQIPVWS